QRYKIARVTGLGVARALLLHDRHRYLSQIVEHEVVDRPVLDLPHWRVKQITPESLARRDANLLFHPADMRVTYPLCTGVLISHSALARMSRELFPFLRAVQDFLLFLRALVCPTQYQTLPGLRNHPP